MPALLPSAPEPAPAPVPVPLGPQHAARRSDLVYYAAITMAEFGPRPAPASAPAPDPDPDPDPDTDTVTNIHNADDARLRDADAMADFVQTPAARPDEGSKLRCCCGRNDCAYLRHSCSVLETVEKDVHTAAKLGKVRLVCCSLFFPIFFPF